MRWITGILLLSFINTYSQVPLLRRICQNGADNNLYWSNESFPCSNFQFYIIWASFDNTTYFPIDTNYNELSKTHTHINANASGGVPNKFYFIERRDSCVSPFNHYSDSLKVDIENYDYSYLDSVSVDINTNQVILGWHSNSSPDFDKYFAYRFNGTYINLNPGGTKDTFLIDNSGSNPSDQALQYDLNTVDSCGNPSTFGTNPHQTIHLKQETDTCEKTTTLNWSPYIGWFKIRIYYIFMNNGSGFILLDSTTDLAYTTPINLGDNYEFYIRAFKDTSIIVSSSSNKINFTTRKRIIPSFVTINYVTTGTPLDENIYFNFNADSIGETKNYKIEVFDSLFTKLNESIYTFSQTNQNINSGLTNNNRYLFKVNCIDFCDKVSLSSDSSNNIVLSKLESDNRRLKWNSYFTWNTGVEYYKIMRGTGENGIYHFDEFLITNDTFNTDSSDLDMEQSYGICYYILAKKSGEFIESKSNIICFPGNFSLYIPNAFVPDGVNNLFRPEGKSIDYQKSIIEIYDRWGQKIYENAIGFGWDGKDQKGNNCSQGVYLYKFNIVSIKNETKTKSGTVTLIR